MKNFVRGQYDEGPSASFFKYDEAHDFLLVRVYGKMHLMNLWLLLSVCRGESICNDFGLDFIFNDDNDDNDNDDDDELSFDNNWELDFERIKGFCNDENEDLLLWLLLLFIDLIRLLLWLLLILLINILLLIYRRLL